MGKILIWRKVVPGNDLDIFHQSDNQSLYVQVQNMFGGICPNWGNKLWFQGLYSEISTADNEISFRQNESLDEINDNYDLIIYPMANFFSQEHVQAMVSLSKVFEKIKIPVYILACGAQAESYEDLDKLVKQIGDPAKQFISAIYSTGGEFALRGNFTKEFFTRLGFSTAVVTGCPSLYQMGPDFQVDGPIKGSTPTKIIVNGKIKYFEKIFKFSPESIYIDQDLYFNPLFQPNYLIEQGQSSFLRSAAIFEYLYGTCAAELIATNRIIMIPDMGPWFSYLKYHGFQYSIGSRIHGNIMSILCNIPATVVAIDTRTKEIADFFDIPYYDLTQRKKKKYFSPEEIFELYHQANYEKFNKNFRSRYESYVDFLRQKGIAQHINYENKFFKDRSNFAEVSSINKYDFIKYADKLKEYRIPIYIAKKVLELKNKLHSSK